MKTLVIANQKGGVGKTALVVHLAYDFAERGKQVAVIDLDAQGNASFSLRGEKRRSSSANLFGEESITDKKEGALIQVWHSDPKLVNLDSHGKIVTERFRKNIQLINSDICLIDTAPSLGWRLVSALFAADFVISPIELEAYSIQGIRLMLQTISNVRSQNRNLKFLGMLPSRVDSRNPRHKRHLEELKEAYKDQIFPAEIGLRSSIADALALGFPVWKIKKTAARKAACEVREVAEKIFKKIHA